MHDKKKHETLKCSYCGCFSPKLDANYKSDQFLINMGSRNGPYFHETHAFVCSASECRECAESLWMTVESEMPSRVPCRSALPDRQLA